MQLSEPILRGNLHTPYWLLHGKSGDPKKFFDSLDSDTQIRLLRAISDYANSEHLNSDRGHSEPWEFQEVNGPLILFKYKAKRRLARFFAVIHEVDGERRAVIVHGYLGHQGQTTKKDREEKEKAEGRVATYLQWLECKGLVQ